MELNYFDTADLYNDGENEQIIGSLLKSNRSKIVLATKVGNVRQADGSTKWDASKHHILMAVEASLKRLQTDYIDLYQLHGGMIEDNIDETIEAFELLKSQGKIRFYGISSIRPNVIPRICSKIKYRERDDAVQFAGQGGRRKAVLKRSNKAVSALYNARQCCTRFAGG